MEKINMKSAFFAMIIWRVAYGQTQIEKMQGQPIDGFVFKEYALSFLNERKQKGELNFIGADITIMELFS